MFDEAGEETLGDISPAGGSPSILDSVVQIVTVFFPVARFRHRGKARVEGGFDQTDSKCFIAINAIRLKAHNVIMSQRGKKVTGFLRNGK